MTYDPRLCKRPDQGAGHRLDHPGRGSGAQARRQPLQMLLPFPRGEDSFVRGDTIEEFVPLLRVRTYRRRHQLCDGEARDDVLRGGGASCRTVGNRLREEGAYTGGEGGGVQTVATDDGEQAGLRVVHPTVQGITWSQGICPEEARDQSRDRRAVLHRLRSRERRPETVPDGTWMEGGRAACGRTGQEERGHRAGL